MQANVLAGNKGDDDWLLLDVIPLSLGLETMGGLVEKSSRATAPSPPPAHKSSPPSRDGQTAMAPHVLQGERSWWPIAAAWRALSCAAFRRWWPARRVFASPSRWTPTGCCRSAPASKAAAWKRVSRSKPSYGLTDDEVSRMPTESIAHVHDDIAARKLAEATVDAEGLLAAIDVALASDGDLLDAAERSALDAAIAAMRAALDARQTVGINQAMATLNEASGDLPPAAWTAISVARRPARKSANCNSHPAAGAAPGGVCETPTMPKIIVPPHADLCPQGALFDAEPGLGICDNLLNNQVDIEHACEMSCPAPPPAMW